VARAEIGVIRQHAEPTHEPDSFIVTVATGAVAIVLLLGLANMLRGGSANRSQNLMRLRVVLQAVAIVLIVLVLWWRGH
jgi:ABC-type nickel/cobalt efflux system permease component RcnA